MELPRLTTIQGAYDYLIAGIVVLALIFGVYFAGVALGVVPAPEQLTGAVVPVG